jgi:hypothetical protein
MKFPLIRYAHESICSCGFPALSPSIPLGTVYKSFGPAVDGFTFICGGCGKELHVKAVKVRRVGQRAVCWMPVDVFEKEEQ